MSRVPVMSAKELALSVQPPRRGVRSDYTQPKLRRFPLDPALSYYVLVSAGQSGKEIKYLRWAGIW